MPTSPLSPPPPAIRRAAVIGAGTMGAAIAAHLTNAGIPTLLLDQPAADADANATGRDAIVQAGLERALRARPPAFMDPSTTSAMLTLGNTADHLPRLAECDWIIEAIVEKPEAKQGLWALVEAHARPDALFSSNSSGIPMTVQSRGRSEGFRRRFLGAHFYNPPRYLYLLELIPTADTAPEALDAVRAFGDRALGKGIVLAHDVPGFIGNRVGIYSLLQTARVAEEMGLSADAADALTGPLLGRPRSGTMRLADTVGLDVLGLISADLSAATTDDFRLPPTMARLLADGRKGEKTGGGYYQRRKNADGTSTILVLDPATLTYSERPPAAGGLPELGSIQKQPLAERIRALLALDTPAGEFTRRTFYEMLRFAAEKLGIVADTAQDIDHAMEWGFGWEMGPFKTIDALGADAVAAGIEKLGLAVPPALAQHAQGKQPFYPPGAEGTAESRSAAGLIALADLKREEPARVVSRREGASLVDLGDGVLLLEFHSKANALGVDAFAAVAEACERVPRGFLGLVIGNQGRWFSAGADLGALLKDAEGGNVAAVTAMIDSFQTMTTRLRAAPFPVVAAPFNMTLGGGCETMLYSDAVQADAELSTGLVELKVGLMPSAGGTTEMLARANARLVPGEDLYPALRETWALITSGQTSGSALEARRRAL
ncbi:MAG: 3-hydroxyacyl-CoA dehydrogenase, partial [Gluconacetobacter diazotrophicus]|nr:3-hydroxyacyl-CoA dehydrogenase [Gluconacetobacter diazotrophicus]